MSEENWVAVGTATTNRTPDSNVDIFLDLDAPSICPNMTDAEFRAMVLKNRDRAVTHVDTRILDLKRWTAKDQARVALWFGSSSEDLRQRLMTGLTALARVLRDLQPKNFVRYSDELVKHLGCVPNNKNGSGVVADVCGPDTATHTICIHVNFCSMREFSWDKDSVVSTLIHEASHFKDTFGTQDHIYYMSKSLPLAKTNPERAIDNADSIAGYVIYEA
ncbi:M35 family metallo-endopeptidase [Caballeronia sordidicola]|jgi:peptidyl-Lys metalloendopeptidase|uniref:M35 family metallo-endopeptidase n=1 Tax=Caballeronia sordidicola TaxID=196367 RepID=UPI000B788C23|nr:M35 family metallo-endopeptidase [Caballeronia sordidicola]